MGAFDCTSVYGNRQSDQAGLNFDHLNRTEKDPDAIPDHAVDVDIPSGDNVFGSMRPFSAARLENSLNDADDVLGITVEGAELAIEVFLVMSRAFPKMPSEDSPDCNTTGQRMPPEYSRKYEKVEQIFAATIYPHVVETKVYAAIADCDDANFKPATFTFSRLHLWEENEMTKKNYRRHPKNLHDGNYKPGKYGVPLPAGFHYFDYSDYGIFKFTGDGDEKNALTPQQLFPEIDPSKQEVWMRVWYYQIWEGIAQAPRYTSFITDPCLVWTCYELDILAHNEIPTRSRAWLWAEARRLILQRQYPDRHFREYALPLLLGRSADPACVFHKDNVPLDMFLLMFRDVFGAAAVARAKRVRSSAAHKRRKVEEQEEQKKGEEK